MAKQSEYHQMLSQSGFLLEEQPQLVGNKSQKMWIGLPKETSKQERRIALSPEAVSVLVRRGFEIWVEKGAGEASHFSDIAYEKAGAIVSPNAKDIFAADTILKVEAPTLAEIDMIKMGATVLSTLNHQARDKAYFQAINDKKILAIAYEWVEDKQGGLPVTRAMGEIAGSTSMLIAAEYLSSIKEGKGRLLGGITGLPPARVVILGAGTVGEFAAKAAIGLGAEIKIFDRELYRLQRIKYALGQQVYTSIIDSDNLTDAIHRADVVIGALRGINGRSPMVVTEEMVAGMEENSVVIDVSIDQGGCIETSKATSHKTPIYKAHGVIHYAVPNIPSRVANTASLALSNIFSPILLKASQTGGLQDMIFNDKHFAKGVYSYKGSLTHLPLAQQHSMRYKDLSLMTPPDFFQIGKN